MKKLLLIILLGASAINAAAREDRQEVKYLAYSARVVVMAEVLRVEPAPGHEDASGANVQDIRYKVVEVLKGETKATEFSVGFTIEFGVPFVELKESRLSPRLFAPGKRHVLFLKTDPATLALEKSRLDGKPESYITPAEHYGLTAADADTIGHLKEFLSGNSREDQESLQRFARDAELVVVAEIAEVQPSPNFWSGFILSTQSVDYRVIEVLKGQLKYPELRVEFLLFQQNPFVDPFKPHLLPEVFKPGNRQVHFLKRHGKGVYFEKAQGRFESFSNFDHLWSAPSDSNTLNNLRQLILTPLDAWVQEISECSHHDERNRVNTQDQKRTV
jgi:hypothetical protein